MHMKFFVFILALVFSVGVGAQEHLDFEGISIDGTIASFTEKMKSKGYVVDPVSKRMPAGVRYFTGPYIPNYDFLEYYSFAVSYDVRTKTVFSVSQVYEFKSTVGGLATCSRLFDETTDHVGADVIEGPHSSFFMACEKSVGFQVVNHIYAQLMGRIF